MWTLLKPLLSPDWYMPHGNCYLWQTPLVWLHVASNALIALSYFSIPAILIYCLRQREDVPFPRILGLFGAFIVLCGVGHLFDVWTLWHPAYWLSGVERAATALVSCYTAAAMVTLLPRFLSLRTPEELEAVNQKLEREVAQRRDVETAMRNIIAGTASVTGEAFFPVLVRHLAHALDVPQVGVYELRDDLLDRRRAIAVWKEGEACDLTRPDVTEADDGSVDIDDYTLRCPLRDIDGSEIGLLCVYDPEASELDPEIEGIVNVFATRAAVELQRQRTEKVLAIANAELEARVRDRTAELARSLDDTKRTQQLLRSIIDTVPGWIFAKDRDYRYLLANDSFSRTYRSTPEAIVGRDDLELGMPIERVFGNPDRDLRGLREDDRCVLNGDVVQQPSHVAYDETGQPRIFDTTKLPLYDENGQPFAILGVAYDVTERHHAQLEAQDSRQQLQTAQRLAHIGSWEADLLTGAMTTSAEFQRLFGTDADATDAEDTSDATENAPLSMDAILERVHPEDRNRVRAGFETAIAQGERDELDYRLLCPNGELRYLFARTEARRDRNGNVVRLVGTTMDVTERKLAEMRLRELKNRERLKAQLLERTIGDLQHAQMQLVQREKMASLGQLVGGVAHEINNPTSFIQGNLTYAGEYAQSLIAALELYDRQACDLDAATVARIEELDLDYIRSDFPKLLDSMRAGVGRISHIVRSLRSFARLDEAELKEVRLNDSLDNTLTLLQSRLNAQAKRIAIPVEKRYGEFGEVECYANSLNQVFLNLIGNAIDAIEERLRSPDAETVQPLVVLETESFDDGRQVRIRVRDNGCGIPEDLQGHLFDPFFTTKEVGRGTGLGLAIAYQSVVQEHDGALSVESEPGRGTTFTVEIPVRQQTSIASGSTARSDVTPTAMGDRPTA